MIKLQFALITFFWGMLAKIIATNNVKDVKKEKIIALFANKIM